MNHNYVKDLYLMSMILQQDTKADSAFYCPCDCEMSISCK